MDEFYYKCIFGESAVVPTHRYDRRRLVSSPLHHIGFRHRCICTNMLCELMIYLHVYVHCLCSIVTRQAPSAAISLFLCPYSLRVYCTACLYCTVPYCVCTVCVMLHALIKQVRRLRYTTLTREGDRVVPLRTSCTHPGGLTVIAQTVRQLHLERLTRILQIPPNAAHGEYGNYIIQIMHSFPNVVLSRRQTCRI